jgi:hypothetical protein
MKVAVLVFLFLTVHELHAQDSLGTNKMMRNALKLGVSGIPTKVFLSYEHAFTKHISAGGMVSYGGTNFFGYTCNIFSRYYFSKFNKKGWFVEARGSYGYYNPYVYSSYYKARVNGYGDETYYYAGKHKANIEYWNAGISGGYKVFCEERIFIELLAGFHFGTASYGTGDNYLERSSFALQFGSNIVEEVFNNSGPASPLHFILNIGYAF